MKYKPKKLNDIFIDRKIKKKFFLIIKFKMMPNLVIFGPPGCGKTSIVTCVINEIYQKKTQGKILEINAAQIRGIDLVRVKIKSFCQVKSNLNINLKKLIIIDEAESLTEIAQEALRRTIENFSHIARFILICNYPSKMIEAIQSRCAILKFKKIRESLILKNIVKIFYSENILFSVSGLELLIFLAEGDIRRILNESERVFNSFSFINNRAIGILCSIPEIFILADFLHSSINQNFFDAYEIFTDIYNYGFGITEIFQGIFKILKITQSLSKKKIKILKILCEFQIQFFNTKSKINHIISMVKKIKQV